MNILPFIPYVSLLISFFTVGGAYIAFRYGYGKALPEIQAKVIQAKNEEIATLEQKIKDVHKDLQKLQSVLAAIQKMLEQRGISIDVQREFIIIKDTQKPAEQVFYINSNDDT